ncbi:MAG: hypothetical protein ACREHE_06870 [Rhizomicrobium sp.]
MPATTVVTDDATIFSETDAQPPVLEGFSWSAALAGTVVAVAVTAFLLALGSGIGLALTTTPDFLHGATPTFLTLGAIYFFAAQAFGFAVGGHLVGRLIGPAAENDKEEEFRAGANGLGMWAVAVVVSAVMAILASVAAQGSAPMALSALVPSRQAPGLAPLATGYLTDTLFRGATQIQASLAGARYAQAEPTTGTDATPVPGGTPLPSGTDDQSGSTVVTPLHQTAAPSDIQITPATPSGAAITNTAVSPDMAPGAAAAPPTARNLAADKAEAGRILDVAMLNAGDLPSDDRVQLAQLVASDTAMSFAAAQRRVDNVMARLRAVETKAAETARKVARNASLWAAFSLLFGAIVSVMAAISARWEDDRIRLFGR